MNNKISPLLITKLNNSNMTFGSNNQKQQDVKIPQTQDTFSKSKNKTIAITTTGIISGGTIGVLKEKFKPKAIPEKILKKYDITNLAPNSQIIRDIQEKISTEDMNSFKRIARKALDKQALTAEDKEFLNNTRLILPEDIKFLLNNDRTPFKNFLQEFVNDISNPEEYFSNLINPAKSSGLTGDVDTWLSALDRILDYLNDCGKYNDNEEFLDYMTTRIYPGKKFNKVVDIYNRPITYVANENAEKDLSNIHIDIPLKISKKTYTYKEMIKRAKQDGLTAYTDVAVVAKRRSVMEDYMSHLAKRVLKEAEGKLENAKNIDVANFKNKQLLKSTGIGAIIVGALALGGNLIYNKIKKDK